MYKPIHYQEIIERVEHIRAVLRGATPADALERITYDRREQRIKDLISNLRRTRGRAMVRTLDDIETDCLLTKDGGYRLFGYALDEIRKYDLMLNGSRTHIVESYIFERDMPIELPFELAEAEEFKHTAMLHSLVRRWQDDIPIRALDRPGWRQPGTFYVHVGTQDSLGSSLPPGSTALVEPIDEREAKQPNPRSIYLLQFPNGYRFSRCVVTRGKLHLLSSGPSYRGPELFLYPGGVRIAGRARVYSMELPQQEYADRRGVWTYHGSAALILPWEHTSRWELLATKHRRFVRRPDDEKHVQETLRSLLHPNLSDRTRRRYRSETASEPHVDTLIQLCLEHFARYSDLLRSGGRGLHDAGRFSLETMLRATRFGDLLGRRSEARVPVPSSVWDARRKEIGEYGALFAQGFPRPRLWEDRAIRMGEDISIEGIDERIRAGSWMLIEEQPVQPEAVVETNARGWARPIYAMRRGLDVLFGHLYSDGNGYILSTREDSVAEQVRLPHEALRSLRRVCSAVLVL